MRRAGRAAAGLIACVALGGCPAGPPIPSLASRLPGFTLVPVPSSLLLPGAVIQVSGADGGAPAGPRSLSIVWLGSLRDCGVPESALRVAPSAMPGIQSDDKVSVDAQIAARAAGLDLGSLGADVSRATELNIASSSDLTLNYLQFAAWANQPANRKSLADACGTILSKRNVFVVQEAFVISSGSYAFQNASGAKVAVAPTQSPVRGGGSITVDHSGSITISAPTVFAIKGLQQLPSGAFDVAALTPPAHFFTFRHAAPMTMAAPGAVPAPPPPGVVPITPAPLDLGGTTITGISGLPPAR